MHRIRYILSSILVLLLPSGVRAELVVSANQFLRLAASTVAENAATYTVDSAALFGIVRSRQHLLIADFPAGDGNVTIELKPAHSPIDSSTKFVQGTSNGDISIAAPEFFVYRGKVAGEPHSKVFLTVFSGQMLCSIRRENGDVFVLGPAKNESDRSLHLLMRESDLLRSSEFAPFDCWSDALVQPNAPTPIDILLHSSKDAQAPAPVGSTLLQTDIAVEADTCFYRNAGGTMDRVLGYIASLFAMSSAIYEDEANITFHLTWVKVWTDYDPYNVAGNASALPDTVRSYWRAHYSDVPRDLAHVMTSVGYGGGGFGWFSLCVRDTSFSVSSPQTGKSYPTFDFTYDCYIVSHEIGHNFSLYHSHSCYWAPPLDTCYTKDDTVHGLRLGDACDSLPVLPRPSPGTIMSYCGMTNYVFSGNDYWKYTVEMTFSPRVDSVLRKNAELATCITPPIDAEVILLSPRGSETYHADSLVEIEWTFANVQNVTLSYSPDGGAHWTSIASGLSAATGKYSWKVPSVVSQRMLIRISDESRLDVADTSLLFFAVVENNAVSEANGATSFRIGDNPVVQKLMINADKSVTRATYDICDVTGATVKAGEATFADGVAQIDVSSLAAGTYFVRITSPVRQVLSFVRVK